ncbi:unnamed protein product, partial [Didymodactylos carnosus]
QINKDDLIVIIKDDQYNDYFQLLRKNTPKNSSSSDKIALTLDLYACTQYAKECKNVDCQYLHLCPYMVKPQYERCTNKSCQFEHDIQKSEHNQAIVAKRGLMQFPANMLKEIVRASNNPERSLRLSIHFRLHYCFFGLSHQCTKFQCDHTLNSECTGYLRRKQIYDANVTDILDAFRKVAKQRNSNYLATLTANSHTTATSKKSSSTILSQTTTTINNLEAESPQSSTGDHIEIETDEDSYIEDLYPLANQGKIEDKLSTAIGCPIKLCLAKRISNKGKQNQFELAHQSSKQTSNLKSMYCPIEKPSDILDYIRWQNSSQTGKLSSLLIYANIQDAHDNTKQQCDNDQFCLLCVRVLNTNNQYKNDQNELKITNPNLIMFQELWLYKYDIF